MNVRVFACVASLALASWFGSTREARAQVINLPSANQPGAGYIIPGTQSVWVDPVSGAVGFRYLGADGKYHGTTSFQNPITGQATTVNYNRPKTFTPQPNVTTPRPMTFGPKSPNLRRP